MGSCRPSIILSAAPDTLRECLAPIFMSGKLGAVAAMPGDGRASPLPMARVQDRSNGAVYECIVLMQDPNHDDHV